MTSLRKQIEALTPFRNSLISRRDVLDIIDAHECFDRDRLARALLSAMSDAYTSIAALEAMAREDADAIIAALEEQE